MDLKPTDEQQAIVDAVKDFAASEVRPAAREAEEAGVVPDRLEKQLLEMGLSAPVAEEFGGQGTFDAVTSVMVAEELAWGDPGVAFSVLSSGVVATVIDQLGTNQQRKDLLDVFVEGGRGSLALAERDAGADPTIIEAEATLNGEGFALTGIKYGVMHADVAPVRLAVARRDEALGVFLIPAEAEVNAQPEDKLGLRAAHTFKVTLDGIESAELLGDGEGEDEILRALSRAKLINAGVALGLARAALEYASDYAQERTAFGRPIGAFQGISFKIADRAMDVETARLLVWRAAWSVDQGAEDAFERVMTACGHAVGAAAAAADDGVQVLGGHGYMKDHPEEMWYRDALTLATFDSPSLVGDLFSARRQGGESQ